MSRFVVVAALTGCLTVTPAPAQDGVERELEALVEATNRLVDVLAKQERERAADSDLRRVGLAVQILGIRADQQEALQTELRRIADQEQWALGNIATNEARLQVLQKQLAEATNEATRIELEAKKSSSLVSLQNSKKRLEHFTQRRVDIENRLLLGERLTTEVEGIVQAWLEELQRDAQ